MILSDKLHAIFHRLLPKQALTALAGYLASIKTPAIKNYLIRYFMRKHHINMSEALDDNLDHYADFNAFFIRQLKPECRPIAPATIVSPVDGYVSQIGEIQKGSLIQAKGRDYSVLELLAGNEALSSTFDNGLFATLYLSPQDYHRVHMPIDATLKEMIYVPGKLFSVQPVTTRVIPKLFARNERLIVIFETPVGLMAMVLVGATIVGAIGTAWEGDVVRSNKPRHVTYAKTDSFSTAMRQAEEMGYFKLGSTVILLFSDKQSVQWKPTLKPGDKIRFGEALG